MLRVGFLVPMRRLRHITIITLLIVSLAVFARHGAALRVWAQTRAGAVRIISPRSGAQLRQNFVTVRFASLQQVAFSTFELRLDAQDPVHTSKTSYTFADLNPAPHDLIIQMVDANNMPIMGTRSEVRFTVLSQAAGGSTAQPTSGSQSRLQTGNQSSGAGDPQQLASLPNGHSSLPLLSVIGFGILVGGVISALKTRPAANR